MSSRSEFDYESAYDLAAVPAWLALPERVRELVLRVCEAVKDTPQDEGDLGITAPPEIHAEVLAFGKVDPAMLAWSAVVAHDVTHWAYGESEHGRVFPRHLVGWKWAKVADRVLSELTGVPYSNYFKTNGLTFTIIEGVLSAGYSTRDSWMFDEIGLATPEFVALVKASPIELRDKEVRAYSATKALRRSLFAKGPVVDADNHVKLLCAGENVEGEHQTGVFMVEHGTLTARRDQRKADRKAFIASFAETVGAGAD